MASVRGLELFGHHFRDFRDRYVLIGSVAFTLTMVDFKQLNLKTNMATIIDRLGESFRPISA